ncbi:MAG: ferredoxin [Actinomycetes bacterium]
MRVIIDRDLCQGHGVCESEAPSIFEVPSQSTTVTLLNQHPDESLRAALMAAVNYCPTHAISISEEE